MKIVERQACKWTLSRHMNIEALCIMKPRFMKCSTLVLVLKLIFLQFTYTFGGTSCHLLNCRSECHKMWHCFNQHVWYKPQCLKYWYVTEFTPEIGLARCPNSFLHWGNVTQQCTLYKYKQPFVYITVSKNRIGT